MLQRGQTPLMICVKKLLANNEFEKFVTKDLPYFDLLEGKNSLAVVEVEFKGEYDLELVYIDEEDDDKYGVNYPRIVMRCDNLGESFPIYIEITYNSKTGELQKELIGVDTQEEDLGHVGVSRGLKKKYKNCDFGTYWNDKARYRNGSDYIGLINEYLILGTTHQA